MAVNYKLSVSVTKPAREQYHLWLLIVLLVLVFAAFVALAVIIYQGEPLTRPVQTESIQSGQSGGQTTNIAPSRQEQDKPQISELPSRFILPPSTWVPQTYNNCAPATVSMVLQQFGYSVGQAEIKQVLRTNSDDRNVFAYEVRDYLKDNYGVESKLLYNGDIEMLKRLTANGFYIIVEYWLHPNEDIGHLAIVRGYDDDKSVLILDDSYRGANLEIPYQEFDQTQWQAFNRTYLPVYRAGQESTVRSIIGPDWDEKTLYQNAIKRNLEETRNNPNNMYGWFNLGSSYFGLGQFEQAKQAFETSQKLGWPHRMLWYQIQPVQNYNALGEYEKALALARQGLFNNDAYAELHFESAVAYKGLGQLGLARQEALKTLQFDSGFSKAQALLKEL